MKQSSKIYVAGHQGLVGAALVRTLQAAGYRLLITRSYSELDLRDQQATHTFFSEERPEYVFLAAARVGGIRANSSFPAQFLYDNLMIAANTVHAAQQYGVKKFLFLASSCIYPRNCPQPIQEDYLLPGPLEPTNEPYALAKIIGVKLCETYQRQYNSTQFIAAMPTNIYGIGDTYDTIYSHVIPALIMKCCQARKRGDDTIFVWGSGTARREFLYVDDLAEALVLLMEQHTEPGWINIGSGSDCSIQELAALIAEESGFAGSILFDKRHPDGTPRKLLDSTRMAAYHWKPRVSLREGLRKTIAAYYHTQEG